VTFSAYKGRMTAPRCGVRGSFTANDRNIQSRQTAIVAQPDPVAFLTRREGCEQHGWCRSTAGAGGLRFPGSETQYA